MEGKERDKMFRKLFKYEWTAMMRSLFPVYGAVLAVTVLNALMFHVIMPGARQTDFSSWPLLGMIPWFTGALYAAVLAALGVMTVLPVIQRFYKGLLREEGYLMFTLPVESWKIVLAKALAAVLMIHISLIVGIFSIGILAGELTFLKAVPKFLEECFNLIIAGFKEDAGMTVHVILFFLEGLLAMIAAWFATVYHFYLAMALGQLAGNHRVAFSVLAYVGISSVFSIKMTALLQTYPLWEPVLERMDMTAAIHVTGCAFLLWQVFQILTEALGTEYLLKHHLNLE